MRLVFISEGDSNYLKLEFEELEHKFNCTRPKKPSDLTVIVENWLIILPQ